MLKNSLLVAWRNLRRNPRYSVINLSGLAIGLACCMAIALFIRDELSYDRFQRQSEAIYRVVQTQQQADGTFQIATTPDPMTTQLQKDYPEVEAATGFRHGSGLLVLGDKATEIKDALFPDSNFFQFFSFPLLTGNKNTVFAQPIPLSSAPPLPKPISAPTGGRRPPPARPSISATNSIRWPASPLTPLPIRASTLRSCFISPTGTVRTTGGATTGRPLSA
jgi:hypothetical protein